MRCSGSKIILLQCILESLDHLVGALVEAAVQSGAVSALESGVMMRSVSLSLVTVVFSTVVVSRSGSGNNQAASMV